MGFQSVAPQASLRPRLRSTKPPSGTVPRLRTTLRRKFILTMLVVSSLIGVTTLAIVLLLSSRSSERRLHEVEHNIEDAITSKGKVLTENHALALRSMVVDNAFVDMQSLLDSVVQQDADLVYGLFTNAEGDALALAVRGVRGEPTKDKDGWKSLGFQKSELSVTKESIHRTRRLGQEVVEVAVPLVGEEGALGTIRYGLSTTRMRQAIAAAKADARAQLLESIKLIGLTVTIATLMGILLSRLQAVRITRPVQDLTQAATDLAQGDRSVRVKIESGDELEMLGFSFNRMVWELATSYDKLADLNRNLEHRVEERTLALAGRNQDMRAVLDNVDQGLLTLAPDGRMAAERSAAVHRWFGRPEGTPTIWQFFEQASPAFASNLEAAWEQVADDVLPLEATLDQLPKRLTTSHACYDLRYLPLLREEKLQSVLVVIADITSQLAYEREEAESRELMQSFRRLMKDRAGFTAFLEDGTALLRTITTPDVADSALRRALHTLKGNAGLLGISVVANLCHQLEETLAVDGKLPPRELAQLEQRWQVLNAHITELAPSQAGLIEVPDAELAGLVSLLERAGQSDALSRILAWKLEPVGRSLARLAEQAQVLAMRLGKGEIEVEVAPTSLRLERERFGPVFSELAHVIRNAVDHGLEPPEDRLAKGKNRGGRITLAAAQANDSLTIQISDDGRGIDWDSVREQGGALRLPTRTPADLLAILCHDGFSTRTEVTEISGRGVGMAAVKRRVEAMGGRIELETALGRGTTWSFIVPVPSPSSGLRASSLVPSPASLLSAGRSS